MPTMALESSTFDDFVSGRDVAVVGFIGNATDEASYATAAGAALAAHPDVAFATVGAGQQDLFAMFGMEGSATAIFRERVVLYLDLGILAGPKLTELLGGAKSLDMAKVRARLDEEKAAQAAMATHLVCPMARRGTAR